MTTNTKCQYRLGRIVQALSAVNKRSSNCKYVKSHNFFPIY